MRKRMAILVGQTDEHYQKQFIEGFFDQAFQNDYDVCVFSMYRKNQEEKDRETGETNIFNLIHYEMFEAVVLMMDTIRAAGVVERLDEVIHRKFKGPVIAVEGESRFFSTIWVDGYHSVKEMVSHLIEVHGYKDIAFLTGKKWNYRVKIRLQAYRNAMEQHGLKVREDRIFYGDFKYQSGKLCAKQLVEHREDLPQAIICLSDDMTYGMYDTLKEEGIRIPEDISVVGVDMSTGTHKCSETITYETVPARECGSTTAKYLMAQLAGEETELVNIPSDLVLGDSCGCGTQTVQEQRPVAADHMTEYMKNGFFSAEKSLPEEILAKKSFKEYIQTVYSNLYMLGDIDSFHLCLTQYWENLGQHLKEGNPGTKYTEKMLYVIRYDRGNEINSRISYTDTFQTSELLPVLNEEREKPAGFFFTPVFFESQCFGYAVLSYGAKAQSYDTFYRLWISTVCWGLESVRRIETINALQNNDTSWEHMDKFAWYKGSAATTMAGLSMEERRELDEVEKILDGNQLTYYFQPIIRAKDGEIYAYEALMRSVPPKDISPINIVKYANLLDRLADVESATFLNVLGIVERNREAFQDKLVFVNSIPGIKMDNRDFVRIEDMIHNNLGTVVIELTEQTEIEDDVLREMKAVYSRLNVELAVDDYGTGYSNVSNLLRYMPNYVKIDRILLSDIHENPKKQHFVREIVEFCHDNNILALAEGVETIEELRTVIRLGVDLIQGFYTGRPSAEIISSIDGKVKSEIKHFQRERQDGMMKNLYVAGETARISLNGLVKGGYTNVVVGQEGMRYKDITFSGIPGLETDIHIEVQSGYSGTITLEDVYFSNVKRRPCIELDDACDVVLKLKGDNMLQGGGIQVPENSSLTVEGDGNLNIKLSSTEHYGIGNDFSSKHGTLIFNQDGEINIEANGQKGILIGSGLGGAIAVNRGKYVFHANGEMYVGIGSYAGEGLLMFHDCNIEMDMMLASGIGFGSVDGSMDIRIWNTTITYNVGGSEVVAIGSMHGKHVTVDIHDANINICQNAQKSTCIGSLIGSSDFSIENASLHISATGKETLAFGGYNDDVKLNMSYSGIFVSIKSLLNTETMAKEENIRIVNCTYQGRINGKESNRVGIDVDF